jgi:hypothetical protein
MSTLKKRNQEFEKTLRAQQKRARKEQRRREAQEQQVTSEKPIKTERTENV